MTGPTPRLPLWIVARFVPRSLADDVTGDLEERWRSDRGSSRLAASWRLTRIALAVALHAAGERRGDREVGAAVRALAGVTQDARHALRRMRHQPAASGAVVATLALALGTTTALFSVVNTWVLRPLPFVEPDRLVAIWETLPSANIDENTPAPAVLAAWRDRATSFEAMAAMTRGTKNLTGEGDPARLTVIRAQPGLLALLGVRPTAGRLFGDTEDRAPAPAVVLLSHRLWQDRFGGAAGVVGRFLTLDGVPHEVLGVLPADARPFGFDADIWTPLAFTPAEWAGKSRFLWVLGRLRAGATVGASSAEIDRIARALSDDASGGRVVGLAEQTLGDTGTDVLVLFGASVFVLLVACANVASLTLAQVIGRRRELVARQALGASRARLLRQLAVESLTIGALGGAAGLACASWATRAVVSIAPAAARLGAAEVFDARVFLFAFAVTAATSVLVALLPAWHSGRASIADALRAGGRGSSGGRRRAMSVLVAMEIAVTLVLLVATGLVTRSFVRLTTADLGFDPAALLLAELPRPADAAAFGFYDEVDRRLREADGVRGVAISQGLPLLAVGSMGSGFVLEDRPAESSVLAYWRSVNAGYFQALGIPIVSGRALSPADRAGAPLVAVVSESFALRAWPDGAPVGRRIGWGNFDAPLVVVGVAADVRQSRSADPSPHVYMPYLQIAEWPPSHIAIRSDLGVAAATDLLKRVVRDADPLQPVVGVRSADVQLWQSMGRRRFHLTLFGILAAMATVLAVLGVYALLSFALSEQRRELGIRAALGATPRQLRRQWWRQGFVLAGAGVALGLATAWWSGGLLDGFLFRVEARDPLAFAAATVTVALAAAAACWLPARRAGIVDPVDTLRAD